MTRVKTAQRASTLEDKQLDKVLEGKEVYEDRIRRLNLRLEQERQKLEEVSSTYKTCLDIKLEYETVIKNALKDPQIGPYFVK